jgi:cytochrome P450
MFCYSSDIGVASLHRKAIKDFTFSEGTRIPKGTVLSAPIVSIHQDEEYYENPTTFDGFRFSKNQEANSK